MLIYMFAIGGRILFGENDPHHFGTIPEAMLFLFQIATLSSWNIIANIQVRVGPLRCSEECHRL